MSVGNQKISVVLPTLNRGRSILSSIFSILGQSYKNLELIVVDDGSGDDTERIVSALTDPRLEYIKHETSRGAPAARNSGIQACSGEIVAFCDSDDIWYPEKIEKTLDVLREVPDLVALCSSSIFFDGRHAIWVPDFLGGEISYLRIGQILQRNCVSTSTLVVRKSALKAVDGFDEDLPRFQDWDLVLRLLSSGPMAIIREPLVLRRLSSDSISGKPALYLTAMEHLYRKHFIEIRQDSKAYSLWLLRIGYIQIKTGRVVRGLIDMIRGGLRNPFQIEAISRWFRNR